ncbi:hypothetical protein DD237_005436 [Peronospora effusa]|uniref:Macro domain-containing protein n=1 Tax=Peronospora effusa TaxID=542832 RepID=A0A425C0U3_9STRA|nr:hypothetical protein DD237_005436 [Peronospora effusa]
MTTPRGNDADIALNDAPTAKRQRLSDAVSSSHAIGRVLDVELVVRGLLAMLDLASLASFLEVLAVDETWREVLTHETLWKELVVLHFAGKLPSDEQFNDENENEEEDGDYGDYGEEEEEEEINDNEPDLLELLEGDMDVEDDASLLEEDLENEEDEVDEAFVSSSSSSPSRSRTGRSGTAVSGQVQQMTIGTDEETVQGTSMTWLADAPSQKLLNAACPDLKEFLRSLEQLIQFDACVQIIRGDIGDIKMVGKQPLDALAFPTATFMRNPHSGVASVIFRRAGEGLSEHVRTLDVRLEVGQVHVTPGFDAGVAKLIHCVGPSGFNPHCLRDLQLTYRSVLRCIQTENLSCVAMASISTGNNGMPVDKAAWFALCAIQRYMRSADWKATIAIVCFEADVYAAFAQSKGKLLTQFNAENVRATPPLRNW